LPSQALRSKFIKQNIDIDDMKYFTDIEIQMTLTISFIPNVNILYKFRMDNAVWDIKVYSHNILQKSFILQNVVKNNFYIIIICLVFHGF
jgi:hypothetical protein